MAEKYEETVKRVQRGRGQRMTDAQIIEALAEEIELYRRKIQLIEQRPEPITPEEIHELKEEVKEMKRALYRHIHRRNEWPAE